MATINLLPRKEFEIIFDTGDILLGKYGTWAVKRFCDLKGIPIEEAIKEDDENVINEQSLSKNLEDAALLILCAVEYSYRLKKKEFQFDVVHAYDWIDKLGGISSELCFALLGHAASDLKEKKSLAKQQALMSYNGGSLQPEEELKNSGVVQ